MYMSYVLLMKITAENNVVPKNIPTFLCPLILNVRDYEYLGKGGKGNGEYN